MTEAQIEANRRNAQKSTGPRTPEGKAASSRNSIIHGLTCDKHIILDEDPGKFILLLNDYHLRLRPRGAAEEQLVQHLVNLEWRLERTLTIEAELYRHRIHEAALARAEQQRKYELQKQFAESHRMPAPDAPVPSPCGPVALAFDADSQGPDTLTNLARYETSLERSIDRTRRRLRALQTERLAREEKMAAAEAALPRVRTNYEAKPKSEGIALPSNEVTEPEWYTIPDEDRHLTDPSTEDA